MVCTEIKILEESLFFPVVLVCVSSVSFIMVTTLSKRRSRRRGRRGQVTRRAKGGDPIQNIFIDKRLSCSSNRDRNYSEVGIVHITDSASPGWLRDNLTDFVNILGGKGFDNRVYNKAKEKAIKKMLNELTKLSSDHKVCDLRMDVEQRGQVVIVNLLGSLYEKHGRRSSSSHRSRSRSY